MSFDQFSQEAAASAFSPAGAVAGPMREPKGPRASAGAKDIDVLVVDDEPEVLAVLKRHLERKRYSVETAADAKAAASALTRFRPRVMLLDLMMPRIDGAAFLRELRLTYSPGSLPVIVVTASDQRDDMLRCLDAGANDFVNKPVDLAALLARIELQMAVCDRVRLLEGGAPSAPSAAVEASAPAWSRGAEEVRAQIKAIRDSGRPVTAVMLDVNRFDELTLAHQIVRGEDALMIYASAVKRHAQPIGDVRQTGPTEFVVIARPGVGAGPLREFARETADGRRFGVQIGEHSVNRVTSSVGVVVAAADAPDDVWFKLKLACRAAAEAGPGRVCEYTDELRDMRVRCVRVESRIARALERKEIEMSYEPIAETGSTRWSGIEARPVWSDQELGLVTMHELFAAADATNSTLDLFELMARKSLRTLRLAREESDKSLFVALDIPDAGAADARLPKLLSRIAAEEGVALSDIVVEASESAVLADLAGCSAVFRVLNDLGVRVAIDNFGSSYASLAYLCRAPAQILKFDSAMLEAAQQRPDARSLLGTTCRMAKHHGKMVVMMGVGGVDERVIAREVGADLIQGHDARAMTAEDVVALTRASS